MPKMIELTDTQYLSISFFVNVDKLIYITKSAYGADVYLGGDKKIYVRETPEQILRLIEEAENDR